jgi:hypothetical protein
MTVRMLLKSIAASSSTPSSDGFDDDPAPTYHALRTHAPVYYWPLADAYLISAAITTSSR